MKGKNEGYLLLEAMLAMVVISVIILFMVTSIMFLLTEEKKCQEELEMAIVIYEMACSVREENHGQEDIMAKSASKDLTITTWNKDSLRIESEDQFLEITKDLP